MKNLKIKKVITFFLLTIFFYSTLIFTDSCQKAAPVTGKPITSKIIYTDVTPDSVILISRPYADTFKLDLNNDGIADFEFDRARIKICEGGLDGAWAYAINLSIRPTGSNNTIMTGGANLALALDSSKTITHDSVWAAASQVLLYGKTGGMGHCITTPAPIRGYWINVSDKYLGLKFIKNNQTYYGWVRLSSSYARDSRPGVNLIKYGQLVLKDYAFNSLSNQPIRAGQKY